MPPKVQPGESTYDGFARYGFRVPSVVVVPYAKRDFVSHTLYDHTSILAFLKRKWNLPALTYRDANANDLTPISSTSRLSQPDNRPFGAAAARRLRRERRDTVLFDLGAGPGPTAGRARPLAGNPQAARDPGRAARSRSAPPSSRRAAARAADLARHPARIVIELHHGRRRVAHHHLQRLAHAERRGILTVHGHRPPAGHYVVVVRHGRRTLLRRAIRVR